VVGVMGSMPSARMSVLVRPEFTGLQVLAASVLLKMPPPLVPA
jgi:hypothetical protein